MELEIQIPTTLLVSSPFKSFLIMATVVGLKENFSVA